MSYCPSLEYLDSLLSNNTWQTYMTGSKGDVVCMFHTVPIEVLNDERYVDWMAKFGKDVDVSDMLTRVIKISFWAIIRSIL